MHLLQITEENLLVSYEFDWIWVPASAKVSLQAVVFNRVVFIEAIGILLQVFIMLILQASAVGMDGLASFI